MPEEQKLSQQQFGAPFEMVTNSKSKKLSPKNLLIIISAAVFLVISVFLGVYLVGKQTNVAQKASPATAIYISPGSQSKAPGSNFTFTVNMDTSTNKVTGVEVRLVFDPAIMQVVSIQQGAGVTDLSQTIANTYDNAAGTISYIVFTLDSSKAVSGTGVEVLKVNASVKSSATSGNSNITFDPATGASASQEGQNVLISKTQGILTVTGSSSTTAPTATALATATATSRATSTATSRATATATSRATSTATSRATATATSRATATATATATGSLNSCGGTCGSNSNCESNYMCYQGYCRNPNCPNESSCGCSTATTSSDTAQSSPLPIPVSGTDWPTLLGIGIGMFTIIASIFLAI